MAKSRRQRAWWVDPDVDKFLEKIPKGIKGPLINKAIRDFVKSAHKEGMITFKLDDNDLALTLETSMFDFTSE